MTVLWILLYVLLGAIGLAVLFFALAFLYSFFIDTSKEYDRSSSIAWLIVRIVCWGGFFFTRSHITTEGMDKLPEGRFVLVANHRSKFDPMLIVHKFRNNHVAFISKDSNFRIPLVGRIIRKCCFMRIDRDDPKAALATVERAVRLIGNDEVSVGVYPEGTRSKDGKLGPFHSFVFRIPVQAKVPVVVAYTSGTEQVARKFPLGGARIRLEILEVLDVDYVTSHRPVEISQRAEQIIRERTEKGE